LPTLLLISEHPEDLAFSKVVAKTAGYELVHAKNLAHGIELFVSSGPKVLFADGSSHAHYQEFETAIHDKVGLFSEQIHPNAIHFISADTFDHASYLLQSPIFGHFIFRRFDNVEECGAHYGRIVMAAGRERAFGLESLLIPGTKTQILKLTSSDQKQQVAEAVKTYLLQAQFQTRIATLIANAVDEIIMNAIFDAPIDETGRTIYTATPRSTVVKLEGKSAVEIQVGFDGAYFGVTAIDHFGSLDKSKMLAHVAKNYSAQQYKVRAASSGAGLGLATIYRSGGSFFMASEMRERTEVTLFFKRTSSYREFKEQFRFFSTQFYF
jgi:hypothetical protein